MTVLANLVIKKKKLNLKPEPVATQALAYILNSSTEIASKFIDITGIDCVAESISEEMVHGDSKPDITIRDDSRLPRIFIENKFWAGLTDEQPLGYLNQLVQNGCTETALIFIVPEKRQLSIESELKTRCNYNSIPIAKQNRLDEGLMVALKDGLEELDMGNKCTGWKIANQKLLITNWQYVISQLFNEAGEHDLKETQNDILQLQGLVKRIDEETILPFSCDELTDLNFPKRWVNYIDLVSQIIEHLNSETEIADTRGLRWTGGMYSSGKHVRFFGRFRLWVGFYPKVWQEFGITPLWLTTNRESEGFSDVVNETWPADFDGRYDAKIIPPWDELCFPIRLKTGVEQHNVVKDAVKQIEEIARWLGEELFEQ